MKNKSLRLSETFPTLSLWPHTFPDQRLQKHSELASLAKANAKSCTSGGVNPRNKTGWGSNTWEQLLRKGAWCSQSTSWTSASRVLCGRKDQWCTELYLLVQSHKVDGSDFWPSTQCLWALRTRQILTNWTEFQKGLQRWCGHKRAGCGSWVCSVRREGLGKI